MSDTDHHEDHKKTYLAIWGILGVLTVVEIGVIFTPLPHVAIVLALVSLASLKALLVARYFMHLKFEPGQLALLAAAPLLFLGIFAVFVAFESHSMTGKSVHTEEARQVAAGNLNAGQEEGETAADAPAETPSAPVPQPAEGH